MKVKNTNKSMQENEIGIGQHLKLSQFSDGNKKIKRSESSVPKLFGFFRWKSSKNLIRRILGAHVAQNEWESELFSNFMQSFSNL